MPHSRVNAGPRGHQLVPETVPESGLADNYLAPCTINHFQKNSLLQVVVTVVVLLFFEHHPEIMLREMNQSPA